jgi:hypothetical protein
MTGSVGYRQRDMIRATAMIAKEYQMCRASASHGQIALNREALIGIVSPLNP